MKLSIIAALLVGLAASSIAAQEKTAKKEPFKSLKDKASYALGLNMGKNLKKQDIDLDVDIFSRGLKEALAGGKVLMTDEQIGEVMQAFEEEVVAQAVEKNKKFLANNKKKEGVKTTKSGLQYKVMKEGTGKKPKMGDFVTCNYKGTTINGEEFDSSYARGKPATFKIGKVIEGWNEALQTMPVGSKWKLFVPSDLAYGERGNPPAIPPNATLIFEVELLDIGKPKEEEIVPKKRSQPKADEEEETDE